MRSLIRKLVRFIRQRDETDNTGSSEAKSSLAFYMRLAQYNATEVREDEADRAAAAAAETPEIITFGADVIDAVDAFLAAAQARRNIVSHTRLKFLHGFIDKFGRTVETGHAHVSNDRFGHLVNTLVIAGVLVGVLFSSVLLIFIRIISPPVTNGRNRPASQRRRTRS